VNIVVAKSLRTLSILAVILPIYGLGYAQSDAQPRPEFRGLFGPEQSAQTRPHRLDLAFSVYDAQDDNTFLATDTDVLDPALQAGQWYSGATAALAYGRRARRSQLTLGAASAARYYPGLHRVVSMRHSGNLGFDTTPFRDWRLQLASTASYSPFYQVVLGPTAPAIWATETAAATDDSSVSKQQAMQYGSTIAVSHSYSEKSSIVFNYGIHYTQVLGDTQVGGGTDSSSQRAGGLFTRRLGKALGLRLGYAYGVAVTGEDPAAAPIRNQDIDVGIDYGRSFALTDGTSFSFSTGSTLVSSAGGRLFGVTGTGRLVQHLGRLWTAKVNYDRGLQVPHGATQPFFSDTVAVNLRGYFNRRISLAIQPTYSHGVVGIAGKTNSYDSVMSSVRLDVALGRKVALYGEHFYYRYQFANADGLPGLLTMGLRRQGARFGLALWAPLVR
jgi:hypothetical protein